MQVLSFNSPNDASLVEKPRPSAGAGESLVRIAYTSLCGSDLSLYRGQSHDFVLPIVPGHEWSGQVVESDDQTLVGLNVIGHLACSCRNCIECISGHPRECPEFGELGFSRDGSCAPFMLIPTENLIALPETCPLDLATQIEPLAVALNVLANLAVTPNDKVGILGLGGIGCLLGLAIKHIGAEIVLLSEPVTERLNTASKLFSSDQTLMYAGEVPTKIRAKMTAAGRPLPDVVIDAAGYGRSAQDSINLARNGGRVGLVGYRTNLRPEIALSEIVIRNLTLKGTLGPGSWISKALALIATGKIDVSPLLTHKFELADYDKALTVALNRSDGNLRSYFYF